MWWAKHHCMHTFFRDMSWKRGRLRPIRSNLGICDKYIVSSVTRHVSFDPNSILFGHNFPNLAVLVVFLWPIYSVELCTSNLCCVLYLLLDLPAILVPFQVLPTPCNPKQYRNECWLTVTPVEPADRCDREAPCEAGCPRNPHRFITPINPFPFLRAVREVSIQVEVTFCHEYLQTVRGQNELQEWVFLSTMKKAVQWKVYKPTGITASGVTLNSCNILLAATPFFCKWRRTGFESFLATMFVLPTWIVVVGCLSISLTCVTWQSSIYKGTSAYILCV